MRNKPLALLFSIILLVAAISGFAVIAATGHLPLATNKAVAIPATPTPDPYGCNTAQQISGDDGAPAIKPQNDGAIAISEQDVRNYYKPYLQQVNVTIDTIQSMTSAQACIELKGVQLGIKPSAIVYLVRLHGIGPAASGGGKFAQSDAFDAHTGNNLVSRISYLPN